MKITVIGVSGGSGSGKTTFSRMLNEAFQKKLGSHCCAILAQDHYYIDQSKKFKGDGDPAVNFDHPSAIDFALLAEHLNLLRAGKSIEVPIYDFATHVRATRTNRFEPRPVVIVDGMLLLSQPILNPFLDYRIFIDTPEATRYERRLYRDVKERGRTPEGVEKQFRLQVKPMHDEFIEPSKTTADAVFSGLVPFDDAIDKVKSRFNDNSK